jgi:hypothetical protein
MIRRGALSARKYSRKFMSRLRKLGIRHFDKLIHHQRKDWLLKNFHAGADEYPVNVSLLIRNIVWQLRERIVSSEKQPLNELIRTFWYMYVKSTLSRAGALSKKPDNQYRQMVKIIRDMVMESRLMKYFDIGFRDDNRAHRKVGLNANILLFSEKLGHQAFLSDIAAKYKISIVALGGKPSVLNVEYFVDSLKEKGIHLNRSFYLFSIVDFDPHGWIVRNSFIKDLKFYGVRNIKLIDLINPDMLTPEEIEISRYRIPAHKDMKLINESWLENVKGKNYKNMRYLIDRKKIKRKRRNILYGLEAESISGKRMAEKLQTVMVPLLGKKEDYLKTYELNNLDETIKKLILHRITGGLK